jgi:hypothetical protein
MSYGSHIRRNRSWLSLRLKFVHPSADSSDERIMAPALVLWIGSSNGLRPGWGEPAASWEIVFHPPATGIALLAPGDFAAVVLEPTASQLIQQVQLIAPGVPVLVYSRVARGGRTPHTSRCTAGSERQLRGIQCGAWRGGEWHWLRLYEALPQSIWCGNGSACW